MTALPPGRPGMESIPPITSTDPSDPEGGTERVSAAGLHRLKERWASFLAEAGRRDMDVDPVAALRCAGALKAAVDRVIASAEQLPTGTGPEKRAVTVTPPRRQTTGTQSC